MSMSAASARPAARGRRVVLLGIIAREELNGQRGYVVSSSGGSAADDRLGIALESGERVPIKRSNLYFSVGTSDDTDLAKWARKLVRCSEHLSARRHAPLRQRKAAPAGSVAAPRHVLG